MWEGLRKSERCERVEEEGVCLRVREFVWEIEIVWKIEIVWNRKSVCVGDRDCVG